MASLGTRRISVLVVDDSAFVRNTLRALIEQDSRFEVVGMAANGEEALTAAARLAPDVLTLDLDMPVRDGMSVLPRLIRDHGQRVLILSAHAAAGSYATFKALALGAVDFVCKPGAGAYLRNLEELGRELRDKLVAVAKVPATRLRPQEHAERAGRGRIVEPPGDLPPAFIVGVGGSTGGTGALEELLLRLSGSLAVAIVIVQHLPKGFARGLASYLAGASAFTVTEAVHGEPLRTRTAYLASGDAHLRVQRVAGDYRLHTDEEGPPLHGYRPAIDVLFYSLAVAARRRAVGILLSGMGGDGGHGLAAIRLLGGRTLAQDYESCVVPEMPMRAAALGGVEQLSPIGEIAATLNGALA
jgi:two-component system, chemotaxis family, protein-glutamate methylesterase/glutaminase